MMASFRTNAQKLDFLSSRISRLQGSLERVEQLGMSTYSANGNTKSFIDMDKLTLELARAEAEFKIISDRLEGISTNPMIKSLIVDFKI